MQSMGVRENENEIKNDEIKINDEMEQLDRDYAAAIADEDSVHNTPFIDYENEILIDDMLRGPEEDSLYSRQDEESKIEKKKEIKRTETSQSTLSNKPPGRTKAADIWVYFNKKRVKNIKKRKKGLIEQWVTKAECNLCSQEFCRNVTVKLIYFFFK